MVEFVQSIRLLSEMEGLIEILVPPAPPSLQGCVKLVWSVTATTHALSMTSANLPGKLGPKTGGLVDPECLHLARCHPQSRPQV